MFGVQFYPTPPKVAERMLDDLKPLITKGTTILEPQSGRGDLVRKISWNTLAQKENIYCIEIDPDLQALLRGHGYHVIGDDLRFAIFDLRGALKWQFPAGTSRIKNRTLKTPIRSTP